jgi:hypothetical protein
LIEAAQAYSHPARISRVILKRQEAVPEAIRQIAWKAQLRLCARFRRLVARGKSRNRVVVAIARELSGFMWAIAKQVPVPQTWKIRYQRAKPLKEQKNKSIKLFQSISRDGTTFRRTLETAMEQAPVPNFRAKSEAAPRRRQVMRLDTQISDWSNVAKLVPFLSMLWSHIPIKTLKKGTGNPVCCWQLPAISAVCLRLPEGNYKNSKIPTILLISDIRTLRRVDISYGYLLP